MTKSNNNNMTKGIGGNILITTCHSTVTFTGLSVITFTRKRCFQWQKLSPIRHVVCRHS
jgi:hypothetical protein